MPLKPADWPDRRPALRPPQSSRGQCLRPPPRIVTSRPWPPSRLPVHCRTSDIVHGVALHASLRGRRTEPSTRSHPPSYMSACRCATTCPPVPSLPSPARNRAAAPVSWVPPCLTSACQALLFFLSSFITVPSEPPWQVPWFWDSWPWSRSDSSTTTTTTTVATTATASCLRLALTDRSNAQSGKMWLAPCRVYGPWWRLFPLCSGRSSTSFIKSKCCITDVL